MARDFVEGPKDVVGLLPADFVATPTVGPVSWSPDGKWLATTSVSNASIPKYRDWLLGHGKAPQTGTGKLLTWDVSAHRLQTIWTYDPDRTKIHSLLWLAQSSRLVLDASTLEDSGWKQNVTMFDASDGSSKTLYTTDEAHSVIVSVSQTRPVGALFYAGSSASAQGQNQMLLVAFNADGEIGRASGIPVNNFALLLSGFGPDGDGPYAFVLPTPTPGSAAKMRTFALTPGSDRLHEIQSEDTSGRSLFVPVKIQPEDLRLVIDKTDEYGRSNVSLAVGKENPSSLFVGGDAVDASLSPTGTAIAYKHADELIVREIVRLPTARWRGLVQGYYEDRVRNLVSSIEGFIRGYQGGDSTKFPDKSGWYQISGSLRADPFFTQSFTYLYDNQAQVTATSLHALVIGEIRTRVLQGQLHGDFTVTWITPGN